MDVHDRIRNVRVITTKKLLFILIILVCQLNYRFQKSHDNKYEKSFDGNRIHFRCSMTHKIPRRKVIFQFDCYKEETH